MSEGKEGDQQGPPPPPPTEKKETGGAEDQISNAVAFLTHPKVSSVSHQSFKGELFFFSLLFHVSKHISSFFFLPRACVRVCLSQVLESSEASKRSFLESKGLSKEQIDEAFQRVGPSRRSNAAGAPTTSSQPPSSAKQAPLAGPQATQAVAQREPLRWTQVRNNRAERANAQLHTHVTEWFGALD